MTNLCDPAIFHDDVPFDFQQMAKIGWWEADFTTNLFTCSKFITEVLGLEKETMTFEHFMSLVHKDHQKRVELNFFILKQFATYDEIFPIKTPDGYLWIHTKSGYVKNTGNGHYTVRGYAQYLSEYKRQEAYEDNTLLQLNDLLSKHNSISHSLLNFLKNEDTGSVINQTLNDILYQFEGDRVYIFEYNMEKETQSCIYEVVRENIERRIDYMQNVPIHIDSWWIKQTRNNLPVIINEVATSDILPSLEKEELKKQNISSLLVVPLKSTEGAWGYMGIDMIHKTRKWNRIDYEWFSSLSNIISICIKLHRSEVKAHQEQEYLTNANKIIRRSEEQLHRIYKNIPVGIEIYDRNGSLIDVNDMELEILGYANKNEALGRGLFQNPYLPADIKEELLKGKDVNFEINYNYSQPNQTNIREKSDIIKNLYIKVSVLHDTNGNIESYMLIIIDNTSTLKAHNKIEEFESFFTYIAEFAEIGIYRWNPIKKSGFASDQWLKNMNEEGHDLTDIIGIYKTIHPDDVKHILNFYDDVINGKKTSMRAEVRIKDQDDWKWIRTNLKVKEYDPVNGNIEVIGVNINISELKKTEAKLLQAKIKAEESDRLKSAFLANMSHEIRTPLNAIVGFSGILAETEDLSDKQQYLNIIHKNNDLLLQLISDILDLSKIESGTFDIIYSNVEVNQLCYETIQPFQSKVPKNVELIFEQSQPQCTIYNDKNRLMQVLANFIGNAMKFTSIGYIKVGYEVKGSIIEFYVEDTGPGVPPEHIDSIFKRFVKLNNFISGTGLGLPICRSIIENMGGKIGVDSEVGEGSRFWFKIPLYPVEKIAGGGIHKTL